MAIQHTDKWIPTESPLGSNTYEIGIPTNSGFTHIADVPNKEQAQSICDAVNNTAGKGIDPNAVPGLLKACKGLLQCIDTGLDVMKALDDAHRAIKSADLK